MDCVVECRNEPYVLSKRPGITRSPNAYAYSMRVFDIFCTGGADFIDLSKQQVRKVI